MSWLAGLRALALSCVLGAAPVLASVPQPRPEAGRQAAADALFAELDARPESSSSSFDVESLNAALGAGARLTYASAGQETPTAPTRLTDFRLELLGDNPATLLTADEVLIWNADTGALIARMNGQQLSSPVRLFERIEMAGLKFDLTDYSNTLDDAVTAALTEDETASIGYEDVSMNVARLVLGGMTLHPWTFEATDGEEEGLAAIRLISAFARSFSLESIVFTDTEISQTITGSGMGGKIVSSYDRQFLAGYDRGNIASMIQTGAAFSGSIPVPAFEAQPDEASDWPIKPVEITGGSGYSAWTGLSFAALLEYGERGELPPITARNLWSFGTYTLADTEMSLGGKAIFEIGSIDVSADKFAWFLPEHISVKHEDASLNLAEILKWAGEIAPSAPPADTGDPTISQITGILERTGLGKLSGDGAFTLTWDSETGSALLASSNSSDGLYTDESRIELRLPTYAQLVPAFGVDGKTPDQPALSALLEENSAFIGGHFSLSDSGLLNALAALTIEIAAFSGENDPVLGNFAGSTPEAVRMFASGMVMFGAGAVSRDLPQATAWISSLSQFINTGGTFRIELAPGAELTASALTGAGTGMTETPDITELVGLFGLSVTHTPADETSAGAP